jgi:hypothetical protein
MYVAAACVSSRTRLATNQNKGDQGDASRGQRGDAFTAGHGPGQDAKEFCLPVNETGMRPVFAPRVLARGWCGERVRASVLPVDDSQKPLRCRRGLCVLDACHGPPVHTREGGGLRIIGGQPLGQRRNAPLRRREGRWGGGPGTSGQPIGAARPHRLRRRVSSRRGDRGPRSHSGTMRSGGA